MESSCGDISANITVECPVPSKAMIEFNKRIQQQLYESEMSKQRVFTEITRQERTITILNREK